MKKSTFLVLLLALFPWPDLMVEDGSAESQDADVTPFINKVALSPNGKFMGKSSFAQARLIGSSVMFQSVSLTTTSWPSGRSVTERGSEEVKKSLK